ncbi:MAG TPA: SPOR domain-containing protein [Caldithrix sp.]|nr:SPOR domain-containing protein [Calditrichaceae bacterium]HEM48747.1 SPOR domain-containing protein [Caldithrix sp.]
MIKNLSILFLLIFFIGCASSSKVQTGIDSGDRDVSGKYDESFDPSTLDDDDIVIGKTDDKTQTKQVANETDKNQATEKIIMHEVEGYRVQILATQGIEAATLQQQKAVDRFSDNGYKVYLIYEAPLYRLRIGDAITRKEAELIRDLAKERGYDEAFIVRSKVMTPESANPGSGL